MVATLCGLLLGANGLRMQPSTRCATTYDGCRIDPVRREKFFSQTQSCFFFFNLRGIHFRCTVDLWFAPWSLNPPLSSWGMHIMSTFMRTPRFNSISISIFHYYNHFDFIIRIDGWPWNTGWFGTIRNACNSDAWWTHCETTLLIALKAGYVLYAPHAGTARRAARTGAWPFGVLWRSEEARDLGSSLWVVIHYGWPAKCSCTSYSDRKQDWPTHLRAVRCSAPQALAREKGPVRPTTQCPCDSKARRLCESGSKTTLGHSNRSARAYQNTEKTRCL